MQEIAKATGYSLMTVSRALRGLPSVNENTRRRILEVARDVGYPLKTASNFARTTKTVGVITPYIDRWYFTKAIAGIEQALHDANIDLLLFNFNQAKGRERIFTESELKEKVDAIIVVSVPLSAEETQFIHAMQLPTAVIGWQHPEFSSFSIDDFAGAQVATQHLINLGHKNIGMITGEVLANPYGFPTHADRRLGFQKTMENAGLEVNPDWIVVADFTMATAERAMNELLASANLPTALFCHSDEMALGALRSLKRNGLSAPKDISIIGFDNYEMAEYMDLTTIEQPVNTLGEMAAWAVLEKMQKPEANLRHLVLPTSLVVRSSTQRLSKS